MKTFKEKFEENLKEFGLIEDIINREEELINYENIQNAYKEYIELITIGYCDYLGEEQLINLACACIKYKKEKGLPAGAVLPTVASYSQCVAEAYMLYIHKEDNPEDFLAYHKALRTQLKGD